MDGRRIEIVENRHFDKPNIYALFPILEATVDLKEWSETPSDEEVAKKLKELIPNLIKHKCSKGYEGGFIERLEEGTYPEHIIEHLTLALQNMAGANVTFGKSRKIDDKLFKIAIEYKNRYLASEALKGSVELLNSIYVDNKNEDELKKVIDNILKNEEEVFESERLGPSTNAILEAASRRDIPVEMLHDEYSFFALGHGKYRQNIWGPLTSRTPMIGCDVSKDKKLCKEILHKNGFPVPKGEIGRTKDEVLEIAERIGYPIVLKPVMGHHGEGVLGDLRSKEEVLEAYEITSKFSQDILVENFVKGEDYRFLVIDNEVVAVANRIPAHVVGDGESNIEELVERVNEDPMRGEGHESLLTKIKIGEEEKAHLKIIKKDPKYVPDEGEEVFLRIGGNISTGGTARDVTDIVHPTIKKEVERVSKIMEMDVLGVDIISEDITKQKEKAGWYIIETNASPGLRMHISPYEGEPKDVGNKIIDMLFPENKGRIPIISVTGTNGKTTTSRLIDWIVRQEGKITGLTVTDGIWINGEKIIDGDTTGPWSAELVLNNRDVEFAIFETARGGIIRKGLGFDRCDVSVVTNIREDHLGADGVKDLYDLFKVKSLVVEATDREGYCVINAEDDFCEDLIEISNGEPVLFSTSINENIDNYISHGLTCFYRKDDNLLYSKGQTEEIIDSIQNIPFLKGGVKFLLENTLAAIAASYCAGIELEHIKKGVRAFKMSEKMNPGRLNTFVHDGKKVILDYAHNPDCFRSLGEYVNSLDGERKISVFTVPGDRDEEMMKESTMEMQRWSDYLILTENPIIMRGRKKGEICSLMEKGITMEKERYVSLDDHKEAIRHAFDVSNEGDIIILADLDVTREEVLSFLNHDGTNPPY